MECLIVIGFGKWSRKIAVWNPSRDYIHTINSKLIVCNLFSILQREAPDPECNKKCANGGWCNNEKICQCPVGYMGQYCKTALCYPQCMNGGYCTAPAVCSCPKGYQGRHCEGGKLNLKKKKKLQYFSFNLFI